MVGLKHELRDWSQHVNQVESDVLESAAECLAVSKDDSTKLNNERKAQDNLGRRVASDGGAKRFIAHHRSAFECFFLVESWQDST